MADDWRQPVALTMLQPRSICADRPGSGRVLLTHEDNRGELQALGETHPPQGRSPRPVDKPAPTLGAPLRFADRGAKPSATRSRNPRTRQHATTLRRVQDEPMGSRVRRRGRNETDPQPWTNP